jgi:hypothetical protein
METGARETSPISLRGERQPGEEKPAGPLSRPGGKEDCAESRDKRFIQCSTRGVSHAPHFQHHVSGRLAIRMDDGTEFIAGPGDITSLPSGHDAWVFGNEPVVVVDWFGAVNYARST